jgi:hypothetical protein
VAVATAAVQSGNGGGAGAASGEAAGVGSRWWEEKGPERQTDAHAGEGAGPSTSQMNSSGLCY